MKLTLSRRTKRGMEPYLWMSLALLLVIFSTVYPLFFAIDRSLWDLQGFRKIEFVGLGNFLRLFEHPRFWLNLYNSAFFTFVGIGIAVVVGFFLALRLRQPSKTNSMYRTLILVPWVTNEVVLALMWVWLLSTRTSPLSYGLGLIGLTMPEILGDRRYALIAVTVINAWRAMGFSLVMMLAALSGVPKEVEEQGQIDGCTNRRLILHIIVPLIRPTVMVMVIVLTMSFFNIIALVLNMTGGGPINATELISIRLYREGFRYFNIATASTLSTIMLIVNLSLAWIYKSLIDSEGYY